jgi:DNA polymerase-3 subunit epsilon
VPNDRIAVIDLETTGLSPWRYDRVVEIGIVLISEDGSVLAEYETLVNPCRDIGPSSIHGISASDVIGAPSFAEVVGDILVLLRNATAIAGHNVAFDRNFLIKEFERVGLSFPEIPVICTYQRLGRSNLLACCEEYGVAPNDMPHRALSDARVTAQLVSVLCAEDPTVISSNRISSVLWPNEPARNTRCFRREDAQLVQAAPPEYLQRLASRLHHDVDAAEPNVLAYLALIDRVLDDRHIDDKEGEAIVESAFHLGLSKSQVESAHRQYLGNLAFQALADGVVTDAEMRDLHLVARLLGQDDTLLDAILDSAANQLACVNQQAGVTPNKFAADGQRVCFTGELICTLKGQPITRDMAEVLAEKAGYAVSNSVTKKLDILVVADPNTQSTKARKAREYNVRILAEAVFWRMAGVAVD